MIPNELNELLLGTRRLKRSSLRSARSLDAPTAAALVAILAASAGVTFTAGRGMIWATVLIAAAGVTLFVVFVRRSARAITTRGARDFARFAELEAAGHTHGMPFAIRRRPPIALPFVLSLVFAAPMSFATFVAGWSIVGPFEIACALAVPAIWWLTFRLSRSIIATLRSTGIELRSGEIAWKDIRVLDLEQLAGYNRSIGPDESLELELTDGRAVSIPLARSVEQPTVIFEIADTIWHRVVGDRVHDLAYIERRQQIAERLLPFSARPVAEQRRSIAALLVVFGVLGFSIHGMECGFVISAAWKPVSIGVALLLTLGGAGWLLARGAYAAMRRRRGIASSMLLLLFACMLLSMVVWFAVGMSWPDLATRAFGSARGFETPYAKIAPTSRKGCQTRIGGGVFDARVPNYFCVEPARYAALSDSGTLHVDVRETWFGQHIVRVSTIDPALHH